MSTKSSMKARPGTKTLSRKIQALFGTFALVLAGMVSVIWAPPTHAVEGFPVTDSGSGTPGATDPN